MNYGDALFDGVMYPLEVASLQAKRRERIRVAFGDVLELGAGTGANLDYYDPEKVGSLTVTDLAISRRLEERAREFARKTGATDGQVVVCRADADLLPFASDSFDTVVFTLVLCSVPDQARALSEVRRVLRPSGKIVFMEHVRPPGPAGHLADGANPVWHAITRECNINRDTAAAIRSAGFRFEAYRESGLGLLIDGIAVPTGI